MLARLFCIPEGTSIELLNASKSYRYRPNGYKDNSRGKGIHLVDTILGSGRCRYHHWQVMTYGVRLKLSVDVFARVACPWQAFIHGHLGF